MEERLHSQVVLLPVSKTATNKFLLSKKRLFAASCSHVRAAEYFIEAIANPFGFVSKECSSYLAYMLGLCDEERSVNIGGNLTVGDAGLYYLRTNSRKPYSIE